MTAIARRYQCRHCDYTTDRKETLGGHVHAAHPEHTRKHAGWPDGLLQHRGPRPGGSLKRDTDVAPGRP